MIESPSGAEVQGAFSSLRLYIHFLGEKESNESYVAAHSFDQIVMKLVEIVMSSGHQHREHAADCLLKLVPTTFSTSSTSSALMQGLVVGTP